VGSGNQHITFPTMKKHVKVLSISSACISLDTEIATAAAISEGLNSKKLIPILISQQAPHYSSRT